MTEKHNWVTDDLCLIEETTGVKLYGTVCTDISFIAKQLNMANKTIRKLEGENKELKRENDTLIKQRLGEERLKQEIADYHTSNGELHRRIRRLIQRLDEFHIEYSDIL